MPEDKNGDFLKMVVVVVASVALLTSLVADFFGREGQLPQTAILFGSVAALVFGAHALTRK